MAKLKDSAISDVEILAFADGTFDFGFELRILASLNSLSFACEHSGTYDDPVTRRPRQFDIRAMHCTEYFRVRLAIECKNLRDNFPLVVFEVSRAERESYHEVIYSHEPESFGSIYPSIKRNGSNFRLDGDCSIYRPGEFVGKACSQVGRLAGGGGDLTGSDAEVYDKWSQAIQSAHDLVELASDDWKLNEKNFCITFVIPVLVIPNERLWRIRYHPDGTRQSLPEKVNRSTMYIDKFVDLPRSMMGIPASLSHLEILTEQGLADFCSGIVSGDFRKKALSSDCLRSHLPPNE